MKILSSPLAGVVVVETTPSSDVRGLFGRIYCEKELAGVIGNRRIVQINHSLTHAVGTVRGLHYQVRPHAEMKLVRCIRGRAWDVAVDLRAGSTTFLQWHGEELSQENGRMLVLAEGVAHGFQTLEADSELLYLHTAFYAPEAEVGVSYNDPRIDIAWPLPVTELSERDRLHPLLRPDFAGIAA